MKPTARQTDTVKKAATQLVAGELRAAAVGLEEFWRDVALDGYAPEPDFDEDGPIAPDIDKDVAYRLERYIEDVAQYVADALYEINPDGDNDKLLDQLEAAMMKELPSVADQAADLYKDGAAYNRNPNAYYGVSNKDFF